MGQEIGADGWGADERADTNLRTPERAGTHTCRVRTYKNGAELKGLELEAPGASEHWV